MNTYINHQTQNPLIFNILAYLFLFSALVVPEQIKFTSIPGLGGLSVSRFLLIGLLPFFIIKIIKTPIGNNEKIILYFSLIFVLACFLSVIYNNSSSKWTLYFIENYILSGLIFITVYRGLKDYKFLLFIMSCIVFVNIFGLYEYITGEILYIGSIVYEDQYIGTIIDGQYRGFDRRNQSVFQNTYSLAIHSIMFLILAIGSLKSLKTSYMMRLFVFINIVILLFLTFQTNVRLVIFLSFLFIAYEFFYKAMKKNIPLLILIIFLFFSLNAIDYVINLYEMFFTQRAHFNSIFARIAQIEVFFSMLDNFDIIIFGLGPGGATNEFYKYGLLAIDNMYLSIFIETGIIGFMFFVIPYIFLTRLTFKYYMFSKTLNYFCYLVIFMLIIFLFNASKEPFLIYSIVTYGFLKELYISKSTYNIKQ